MQLCQNLVQIAICFLEFVVTFIGFRCLSWKFLWIFVKKFAIATVLINLD